MDIIGNLMEEIRALFHHSAAQSGGATQPTASHVRKLNQGDINFLSMQKAYKESFAQPIKEESEGKTAADGSQVIDNAEQPAP